jgi:tetratricopeptide (TPR) repeat protein
MNPNNPDVFFAIGENSFGQGGTYDIMRAETAYSKAVELRPNFPEAHYQLGRVYFIQGRFHPALIEMTIVLRLDPEFKKAYYMYGLISGYQKNYDEAIYGFSEFIRRDDFNWAGYNDLAWIYFQKGDYEKTRDTAKEGLKRAEMNPWLQNVYGTALMNLGEKESAQKAFRKALRETESMTPAQWGGAYPGNDPRSYVQGLEQMKAAIRHNLELLENRAPQT